MNGCAKVRGLLSGYLDKETGEADTVLVKSHVAACAACRDELEALSRVKEMVSSSGRKELPPGYMYARVHEQIAGQAAGESFSPLDVMGNLARRLIPVPVAVIIASLAFFLVVTAHGADSFALEDQMISGTQTTTDTVLGVILGA